MKESDYSNDIDGLYRTFNIYHQFMHFLKSSFHLLKIELLILVRAQPHIGCGSKV